MKKHITFLFFLLAAALFLNASAMAKDAKPKVGEVLAKAVRNATDSDASSGTMIGTFSSNPTYQNAHAVPLEEQPEEDPEDTEERSQRIMRDILGAQEK